MKPRLKFTRNGWSKFLFEFHTGSIMYGSGVWVPYVDPRTGKPWPPAVEYWSTPQPSAAAAVAFPGF